jgi:hypothetical protein
MLDAPSKYMRRELTNVLETVLAFRKLVKRYLLTSDSDNDFAMEESRQTLESEGIGLLKVRRSDFSAVYTECQAEF